MENPFKYGGIVRGPYFADRTEELANLVQEMKYLSNAKILHYNISGTVSK